MLTPFPAKRNKRLFQWGLGAAVLLAVIAGAFAWGLTQGLMRLNHPDRARFPSWGLDVSHHQGEIRWDEVAQVEGLHFVYVKATEGGDFRDRNFERNAAEARRVGLTVGAYHFFTFCRSGAEQAKHFLAVAPRVEGDLVPAVDVEFGGNCGKTPTPEELERELAAFLQPLREAYRHEPVIYATPEAYTAYFTTRFLDSPLWIRNIYREPKLPGGRDWTFWQFANRERIRGIDGPVDLNVAQRPMR